jgi:hypothetical protein
MKKMSKRKYTPENPKFTEIKNRMGITNKEIADWFGYKDSNSLKTSSRKNHIINGIIHFYEAMEELERWKLREEKEPQKIKLTNHLKER